MYLSLFSFDNLVTVFLISLWFSFLTKKQDFGLQSSFFNTTGINPYLLPTARAAEPPPLQFKEIIKPQLSKICFAFLLSSLTLPLKKYFYIYSNYKILKIASRNLPNKYIILI